MVLNDEKYDFSKESNLKEKLYEECIDKKKELENHQTARIPVSFDELEGTVITKIDKNKANTNEIKMDRGKNK